MLDIKNIIIQMTFEEKCKIITGVGELSTFAIEKYGIPKIEFSDGPHGVRRSKNNPQCPQICHIEGGDVAMPTASAVGASWSTDNAYMAGETLAKDCMEEGIDMLLAPGVNMKRTPHCGRNFEYYAEDPYLAGRLGAAFINGIQSKGIGTSLKHYAANNQEIRRFKINAEIDERTLKEYYLKVFEIVLKYSNPTSVMCSYNKINGIWASENRYLLTDLLKETWGYDGLVISDWGAVHDVGKCMKAGLDLQMPQNPDIVSQIQEALDKGFIEMVDVDRAVESILKFINRILSMRIPKEEYDRKAQHEAAYKAACESITLLCNENDILPITKDKYKKIAILGEASKKPVIMGGGSSKVTVKPESIDIPWDCILENSDGIECDYIPMINDEFLDEETIRCIDKCKSGGYDAVICFVNNNYGPDCETESFDRDNIKLSNYIGAVVARGVTEIDNFVVVTQFGSAVIPYGWEKAKAVLQMWYAGEAGGRAVADILFGKVNPSGKLSETFMLKDRTDIDYPGDEKKVCYNEKFYCGYRYYDKHPEEIWYPFGHGISYTTYEYSDIKLSQKSFDSDSFTFDVSFKVKNVGNMSGKEVVQLYISPKDSIVDRPVKELKRFDKVSLDPGEEKTVSFTIESSDLSYYNVCLRDWHVESGNYGILIGASSRDIRLEENISVSYQTDYTI